MAGSVISIHVPNAIEKPLNITQSMPIRKISTAILFQAGLLHNKLFQMWRKPNPSHLKQEDRCKTANNFPKTENKLTVFSQLKPHITVLFFNIFLTCHLY